MSNLTFGPEWLRALSNGKDSKPPPSSNPFARFKLADNRYGREEMLALFTADAKMPPELNDFEDIIREKPGVPLSFVSLTDEEERCQLGGVNSGLVLRISSRGGEANRGRGVRGGRGRGRGDGIMPAYHRSLSSEEEISPRREAYGRSPWIDTGTRGGRGDSSGVGRGFESRPRLKSDDFRGTGNSWRQISPEDEDGNRWRMTGGQKSYQKRAADASRNWRDPKEREKELEAVNEQIDTSNRSRPWERTNNDREDNGWKGASHRPSGGLPEWCVEDSKENITYGTFDSSGAFKTLEDKDDKQRNGKEDTNVSSKKKNVSIHDKDDTDNVFNGQEKTETNVSNFKYIESQQEKSDTNSTEIKTTSILDKNTREKNITELNNTNILSDSTHEHERLCESPVLKQRLHSESSITIQNDPIKSVHNKNIENNNIVTSINVNGMENNLRTTNNKLEPNRTDHDGIELSLEKMVAKLDDEDEDSFHRKSVPLSKQKIRPENIDDPCIVYAKKAEPGTNLMKGIQDWIYRDPQGEIQGPFSSEEMLEWFKAGYFTMGLLVRRVIDEVFLPLGDVIKLWNRVPFLPSTLASSPPPITSQLLAVQEQAQREQQREQHQIMKQQQEEQMRLAMLQQQEEHRRLAMLQQLQEKQQIKDLKQRPQNLTIGQDISIWGDSPQPSPNLASTPWSPSNGPLEQPPWNQQRSTQNELERTQQDIEDKRRAEKDAELEKIQRDVEDEERHRQQQQKHKKTDNERQKELELQKQKEVEAKRQKETMEKKKPDEDKKEEKQQPEKKRNKKDSKKKEEREKQRQREEEQRKALENLQQQQQKLELQKKAEEKKKEEKRRQQDIQQQLMLQQQQQLLQQQQLIQQQQHSQQHPQARMQQRQTNDVSSWPLPNSSNAPSLSEIQRMEEVRQMEMVDKLQQLHAEQQAHQQQQKQQRFPGWHGQGNKPPSLKEIQEEEARLLAAARSGRKQQQQPKQSYNNSSVWNSNSLSYQDNGFDSRPTDITSAGSFWDDVMNMPPSVNNSTHSNRNQGKSSQSISDSTSNKQKKSNKDEEFVRRLFQQVNPSEEFIQWVNNSLPGIARLVDVPTFVTFLQDIESTYEVHEYIRTYFGETQEAQRFAKEFLEWRKHYKQQSNQGNLSLSMGGTSSVMELGSSESEDANSKKKRKKRMQKVNPNLLGFSTTSNPDQVNRGEIQSFEDAWKTK